MSDTQTTENTDNTDTTQTMKDVSHETESIQSCFERGRKHNSNTDTD